MPGRASNCSVWLRRPPAPLGSGACRHRSTAVTTRTLRSSASSRRSTSSRPGRARRADAGWLRTRQLVLGQSSDLHPRACRSVGQAGRVSGVFRRRCRISARIYALAGPPGETLSFVAMGDQFKGDCRYGAERVVATGRRSRHLRHSSALLMALPGVRSPSSVHHSACGGRLCAGTGRS